VSRIHQLDLFCAKPPNMRTLYYTYIRTSCFDFLLLIKIKGPLLFHGSKTHPFTNTHVSLYLTLGMRSIERSANFFHQQQRFCSSATEKSLILIARATRSLAQGAKTHLRSAFSAEEKGSSVQFFHFNISRWRWRRRRIE